MITRMMIHSVVFTIAIALGAVAANGVGLLDNGKPDGRSWYASNSEFGGDFGKRKWGHDDD